MRMSSLYDLAAAVTRHLEATHAGDPIGLVRAKGELATRAGFLVTMVARTDADDPDKVYRLRSAAAQLGIPL
ncbi:MAG: hypothetical protein Q7W30_10535 [Coriobacteriia bacterium]|nr:hypothetical protein [Coriobacteriia bacterium]